MAEKIWAALSNELADAAAMVGKSVVAVLAGRHPGSGIVWTSDSVVTANHVVRRDEEIAVITSAGQEVVARSQFRGTLKRRAYLAHSTEALNAGAEIFHEADPSQPCGLVAQAAPAPSGGWDAIVSIQVSTAQGGRLSVASAQGTELTARPAPYPLLADV